jgi:hypothetical protein
MAANYKKIYWLFCSVIAGMAAADVLETIPSGTCTSLLYYSVFACIIVEMLIFA